MEAKKKALDLGSIYFKRSCDQLDTRDFMVYVRDNPQMTVPMFKLAPKELSIVGYGKHMEITSACVCLFVEVRSTSRPVKRKVKMAAVTD